ncbi:ATP-binding cassette domain-containing protein, partial [Acinetobacter baumannii]|nr:ATP-binding cassette domain-containing protein [Acinetobacter baumannii]
MPAYLSPDIDEFKERALELLKQIGLEEFANEYPSNLSGGEIRRVSIIRAIINNPKVIVADEPTSNLDPE